MSIPTAICHVSPSKDAKRYLVFFITGNPGLISYYTTFLSYLYASLHTSKKLENIAVHVAGRSLGGFEVDEKCGKRDKKYISEQNDSLEKILNEPWESHGTLEKSPPYSLQEQIEGVEKALITSVEHLSRNQRQGEELKIILIGHSVGSYILLEILRRHRERMLRFSSQELGGNESERRNRIVGGICLFPTVVDIAHSQSGRRLGPLLRFRYCAIIGSLLARLITALLPHLIFLSMIKLLTKLPDGAARITAKFLGSQEGVRQALHMARDEMDTITTDKWDEEIWGAAHESPSGCPRPTLIFLFGKEDHWVADETRDELVRIRGELQSSQDKQTWKPKMDIDETESWPHGFSLRHSIPVAEKVKVYIEQIIQEDISQD